MNKQNTKKILAIASLGFFINFSFALASELDGFEEMINQFFENNKSDITIIENNIESFSNTGSNVAQDGEIIKGESESVLKIKSMVNGEVIKDIKIIKENEAGEEKIDHESVIEINDDKLKVESTREVNTEIEKRTAELLTDEESKEKLDVLLSEEAEFIKKELEVEDGRYDEIIFEIKNEENINEENILKEEDGLMLKFISIVFDLFKNNIDKISRLFY